MHMNKKNKYYKYRDISFYKVENDIVYYRNTELKDWYKSCPLCTFNMLLERGDTVLVEITEEEMFMTLL